MDILNSRISPDKFFSDLSKVHHRILMLDYDGTLSPFTSKRDEAYPYAGVEEIINQIIDDINQELYLE